MSLEVQIESVGRQPSDLDRFLEVSYSIYRDDPNWVAPLLMDQKQVFSEKNPFFEHAEMRLWMATRAGQDVGRIAAVLDQSHNALHHERTVFFGFYECVDDQVVSARLFETVVAWAKARGAQRVLGPMNPSTNDECGLLVEGFDSSPALMMTYNPRYYVDHVVAAGFQKAKDLLAFHIDLAKSPLDRLNRLAEKSRQRNPDLRFRPVTKSTLSADLAKIKVVYNRAWEHNWGFVPMTDAEIDFMAGRLKALLVRGLVWLVESPTEPVAFMLATTDFNQALKPLRGRVFSRGFFEFLPYALGLKHPTRSRVITLGVVEGFRGRGLEAVMLSEGLKVGAKLGFKDAEASWVLEENVKMRRMIELFGATAYKTYRLYDRPVDRLPAAGAGPDAGP